MIFFNLKLYFIQYVLNVTAKQDLSANAFSDKMDCSEDGYITEVSTCMIPTYLFPCLLLFLCMHYLTMEHLFLPASFFANNLDVARVLSLAPSQMMIFFTCSNECKHYKLITLKSTVSNHNKLILSQVLMYREVTPPFPKKSVCEQ
jgi:hypothetical protein